MSDMNSGSLTALDYERAAEEYLHSLPLEHFMEAIPQATQREITVESLALLKTRRADVQYFNELLVQYLFKGRLRQVVPDNMLMISSAASQARGSYAVELEPAPPFLVLDYVSPSSTRKDYEESFHKYEHELKVPYCLMFYPEKQDLRVHRHEGASYVRMEPDVNGRCAIPELDLEVGLLDQWVRFWYQGRLLELPGELQRRLDQVEETAQMQAQQIGQLKNQVESQAAQLKHFLDLLSQQVAERARRAGRQDILEQLPATRDLAQLGQWLAELGS